VNRNFSQSISVRISDPEKAATLVALMVEWDRDQATADIMGYMGGKILQDREDPDVYVIVADFGIVDPDVSAYEEAMRNNDREKTQQWHRLLLELVDVEPTYREFDELYRTG
jgi:hypothetical protein